MNPGGHLPPFSVTFRDGILGRLRGWAVLAARRGIGPEYLAALHEAEQQLRTRPRDWGDPIYDLHHLQLTIYQRYTPLLVYRYAVHTTRPVVFVREVVITPGSPLIG